MNDYTLIHEKLDVMKKCYRQRDLANLNLIYQTFFNDNVCSIVIGTDNGEWFRTKEQFYELFAYDWQNWGDVTIDPYGFAVTKNGAYDFVRAKALLDFHEDRAWDLDILMVFEDYNSDLICRLMQFKVPRNLIRPTVMLNGHPEEQKKYDQEQLDLKALSTSMNGTFPVEKLASLLKEQLKKQRPYMTDIQLPAEQVVALCDDNEYFFYACTGLCTQEETGDVLPFRIAGIGTANANDLTIIDSELSHPFVTALG